MARWMKPTEEMPSCDCGDRVIGIVRYSVPYNDGFGDLPSHGPIQPHVIILVAEEDGWRDVEDGGYTVDDCELWTMEQELVQVANAVASPVDPLVRRTIELTDDIRQHEPMAWMVFLHDTTVYEYRIFGDHSDAERCAEDQGEESGSDWLIYPLYATHGER